MALPQPLPLPRRATAEHRHRWGRRKACGPLRARTPSGVTAEHRHSRMGACPPSYSVRRLRGPLGSGGGPRAEARGGPVDRTSCVGAATAAVRGQEALPLPRLQPRHRPRAGARGGGSSGSGRHASALARQLLGPPSHPPCGTHRATSLRRRTPISGSALAPLGRSGDLRAGLGPGRCEDVSATGRSARRQKAASITFRPSGPTDTTSKRMSENRGARREWLPAGPCRSTPGPFPNQEPAALRIRARLRGVTASSGAPKRVLLRAFTSQNTSVSPSQATMSSSPELQRQLRSTICQPRCSYQAAARSSARRPRAAPCVTPPSPAAPPRSRP